MHEWPHAPPHRTFQPGTYMITGATYLKKHHLRTAARLDEFSSLLITSLEDLGWGVQAWSVFSNHYHLVATNIESPDSLREAFQAVHSKSGISLNGEDSAAGRRVWYQYWDTILTFEKSYLARLNYVMSNPVKHGLVREAARYPWCSAGWFEETCPRSFVKTVQSFKTDRLKILDDFDVLPAEEL
jgi:putative transposase